MIFIIVCVCPVVLIVHWGGVISFSHFMLYPLVLAYMFFLSPCVASYNICMSVHVGIGSAY